MYLNSGHPQQCVLSSVVSASGGDELTVKKAVLTGDLVAGSLPLPEIVSNASLFVVLLTET